MAAEPKGTSLARASTLGTVFLLLVSSANSVGAQQAVVPSPANPPVKESAVVPDPKNSQAKAVVTNSIGMKLVLIRPGEFLMGSSKAEQQEAMKHSVWKWAIPIETPQHRVKITKPFYLGMHEVTQEQYYKVMGENPSTFKGPKVGSGRPLPSTDTKPTKSKRPVDRVSWEKAVEFCRRLSKKEGKKYRLPTEAEWEYACRAGTTTRWHFGDSESLLKNYAWYVGNSREQTHPVGQKKPNAWGLYDMHGNAMEWCADWCDDNYYARSPLRDPKGADSAEHRAIRGGDNDTYPWDCRSASRSRAPPNAVAYIMIAVGFRVARDP